MIRWVITLGSLVAVAGCVSHTEQFYRGGTSPVATPHVAARLLMVGDAGHSTSDSSVLRALTQRASVDPERTLVVFLGDNIYPAGLPAAEANDYATAAAHLRAQIDAVRASGARGVFVPGNHDWDNSGPDGLNAVKRQAKFIREHGAGKLRTLPSEGEPGPVCEEFAGLRLVFLDTQWWLHAYAKTHADDPDYGTTILTRLDLCLKTSGDRKTVVFAHHPLQTRGPHGGFATWQDHLFPLTRLDERLYFPFPGLGSAYVWARDHGASNQDLTGSKNVHMGQMLERVLQRSEPLLFAAGHEHNLQVSQGLHGSRFHVVSGSGSGLSDVGDGPETLFAQAAPGFVELEVTQAGRAVATVHSQNGTAEVRPVWRYVLE